MLGTELLSLGKIIRLSISIFIWTVNHKTGEIGWLPQAQFGTRNHPIPQLVSWSFGLLIPACQWLWRFLFTGFN
jgi:hypothetical protein